MRQHDVNADTLYPLALSSNHWPEYMSPLACRNLHQARQIWSSGSYQIVHIAARLIVSISERQQTHTHTPNHVEIRNHVLKAKTGFIWGSAFKNLTNTSLSGVPADAMRLVSPELAVIAATIWPREEWNLKPGNKNLQMVWSSHIQLP